MKILLSLAIADICLFMCHAYRPVAKGNNYLQFLRANKFMQIERKSPILYGDNSEDLDELDSYEEKEETVITNNLKDNNVDKIEFKNVETLLKKNENKYNDDDNNNNNIGTSKACTISENGILDVSINENDIFNTKNYLVQITSSSIIITENELDRNIIKTVPFESIKLPIETIEETRECWILKTDTGNIMFCGKNKHERDTWIQNILMALFCYNTNNLRIKKNIFETNEKIQLPKESTIEKRIQDKREQAILSNRKQHMDYKQSHRNTDYKSEDITDLDLDLDMNE